MPNAASDKNNFSRNYNEEVTKKRNETGSKIKKQQKRNNLPAVQMHF